MDEQNYTPVSVTNPNTVGWRDLYRIEHGLGADVNVDEFKPSDVDRANLYLKYNSINPDAMLAYDRYLDVIGGRTYSDQGAYDADKAKVTQMTNLDNVYTQNRLGDLATGAVPTYSTILPTYGTPTTPTYADGGIVNTYEQLANAGRSGDSELAWVTPREQEMLRQMGGAGTINPSTGLREYKGGGGSWTAPVDPNTVASVNAATLNTGLTQPTTTVSTAPTYTAPTMRIVPTTDTLAPTGGSELQKLMRAYGVSTASASPYGGVSKPTAPTAVTTAAPTTLTGMVTPNQVNAYNAARDAYNTGMANYNTAVGTYNTNLNQYGLDQAKYDQYVAEYNRRMQSGNNIYNQAQFGRTSLDPNDILLAPTYAEGGEVKEPEYGSNEQIAALAAKYRGANEALMEMLNRQIESPEAARSAKQQMYFNLASALSAPTKTGTFSETLGNAANVMGEYAATKREAELNQIKLRLEGQKYQAAMTKEDLGAALEAQKNAQTLAFKQNQLDLQQQEAAANTTYRSRMAGAAETRAQAAMTATQSKGAGANGVATPEAKQGLANTIDLIKGQYDILKKNKAIATKDMSGAETAWAGFTTSAPMQAFERMTGDTSQKARDAIIALRSQLMSDIMKATGMKATQLNSDIELQNFLKGMGDPTVSYETNMMLLKNLEDRYGVGGKEVPSAAKAVDFNSLK